MALSGKTAIVTGASSGFGQATARSLAAHVLVEPGVDCHDARRRLQHVLEDEFGLRHTTLQVDHVARRGQDVRLGALHQS